MASTTSDLTLLGRKLGALDYNPELYVKEIARRSVGGHELLQQRKNIKVMKLLCNFIYDVLQIWHAFHIFCRRYLKAHTRN